MIFFSNLVKPSIEQSSSDELDQPITLKELYVAVSSLQSGKSPGPDEFPVEFYKVFWICFMNNWKKAFSLRPSVRLLSLFFCKKGKDPLDCTSFRPIGLINVDFKLLSKLLALRLEHVLPTIISVDQTGFIRNRHLFSNLRQLFNIIYSPSQAYNFITAG